MMKFRDYVSSFYELLESWARSETKERNNVRLERTFGLQGQNVNLVLFLFNGRKIYSFHY